MNKTYNFRNNFASKMQNQPTFTGRREDNNIVEELTKEGTLNLAKEKKILKTLEKLSNDGSSSNIKFLLNVSKNLKYGIPKDSPLNKFMTSQSSIRDQKEHQNVDWNKILFRTLYHAISKNKSPEKRHFESELKELAYPSKPKTIEMISTPDNPVFLKQAELIKLRDEILNQESIKDSVDLLPKDSTHSIKNNLDYFLAMSECSLSEKVECLKILNHMMSENYNVHPQLKDKKVQIITEILNDILVKTPDSNKFLIKQVDQGAKGKCAAISMSRKAMPYEHKLSYVSNLMAELNDNPTMEVYDVTDPTGQKKITVSKAKIDYDIEVRNRSRIIDAASENWMNIANIDLSGNQVAKYISSDEEHYGMFTDGHYLPDLTGEDYNKQQFLRASQKLEDVIKAIENADVDSLAKYQDIKTARKSLEFYTGVAFTQTQQILLSSIEGISKEKASFVTDMLLSPALVKDKELKIDESEDDFVKRQKLKAIIIKETATLDSIELDKAADAILKEYKALSDAKAVEKQQNQANTNKHSLKYNSRLFKLAAYNRVKMEFRLDIQEELEKVAKQYNLPADKTVILQKLENTGEILPREALNQIKTKLWAAADPDNKKHKLDLTEKEKQLLFNYSKKLSKIKKENKRDVINLIKELEPQLKELYSDYARSKGHFWIGPEGRSGLVVSDQINNFSMITGADHYAEDDPKKALDAIENGVGDSISGTNVSSNVISGHAQYAYGVEERKILDQKTGEFVVERFLAHDNTWGAKAESSHVWKDAAGNIRTDYKQKMGGDNGFIAFDEGTSGVAETDLVEGKGYDEKIKYEFDIYKDIILSGTFDSLKEDTTSLIREFPTKEHAALSTNMYISGLLNGNVPDIKDFQGELNKAISSALISNMENEADISIENIVRETAKNYSSEIFKTNSSFEIAKSIQDRIEALYQDAELNTSDKIFRTIFILKEAEKIIDSEIKNHAQTGKQVNIKAANTNSSSFNYVKNAVYKKIGIEKQPTPGQKIETEKIKQDYEKLAQDDLINILLRKISLKETTTNKKILATIKNAKTPEELDNIVSSIVTDKKQSLKTTIQKGIFSIEELQKTKEGKLLINWIDKKYNPKNDDELISINKKLKAIDEKDLNRILETSTNEMLGINPRDSFTIYEKIRRFDKSELSKLNTVVYEHYNDRFGHKDYELEIAQIQEEHDIWLKSSEAASMSDVQKTTRLNKKIINATAKYPEIMYQNLSSYFSYLDIGKMVDSYKGMLLERNLHTGLPVRNIIKPEELEKLTSTDIDKLITLASAVTAIRKKYEKSPSLDGETELNEAMNSLNKLSDVFVRGNVRPRSRSKVQRALNDLYTAIYRDNSEMAQKNYKLVIKTVLEEHMLKHPQDLLDAVANEVPLFDLTDQKNKTFNQELVNIWSSYLTMAKNAADNTIFEILIMKNVEDGKMPQIAKQLKSSEMAVLTGKNGQKTSLDSEAGLEFIFKSLEDPANNNKTLKYFLKQTGMVDSAINQIMSAPTPDKHIKFVKLISQKCDERQLQINFINGLFDEFMNSEILNINPVTTQEVIDALNKKLDETYVGKFETKFPLKEYKEKMELYIQEHSQEESDPIELVKKAHTFINDTLDDYSEEAIERIIAQQNILTKQKNSVAVISDIIPSNSELKSKVDEYITDIDQSINVIDEYRQKYQNPILEKINVKHENDMSNKIQTSKTVEDIKGDYKKQLKMLFDSINVDDQLSQKIAINLLIKNEDAQLIDVLNDILLDKNQPEIARTYAAGILWSKGNITPLIDYAQHSLGKLNKLDNEIQDDQALIMSAEAIIDNLSKTDDKDTIEKATPVLENLFVASCAKDAQTPLADQLLQRFINSLPNKGSNIDKLVYKVATAPSSDLNAKIVAIDVLGRSDTSAFFPLFEDMVIAPENYVKDKKDILSVLDVVTKSVESMVKYYPLINYAKLSIGLDKIDTKDLLTYCQFNTEEEKEYADSVAKRVNTRIKSIYNILEKD